MVTVVFYSYIVSRDWVYAIILSYSFLSDFELEDEIISIYYNVYLINNVYYGYRILSIKKQEDILMKI